MDPLQEIAETLAGLAVRLRVLGEDTYAQQLDAMVHALTWAVQQREKAAAEKATSQES